MKDTLSWRIAGVTLAALGLGVAGISTAAIAQADAPSTAVVHFLTAPSSNSTLPTTPGTYSGPQYGASDVTWPQTYLPGDLPTCGGVIQNDTEQTGDLLTSIENSGKLTLVNGSPEDSTIVQSWTFTVLPACPITVPQPAHAVATPPTCTAAGSFTVPANYATTDGLGMVKYIVTNAASTTVTGVQGPGTYSVSVHTTIGYVFSGSGTTNGGREIDYTVSVLPKLAGAACVTTTPTATPDTTAPAPVVTPAKSAVAVVAAPVVTDSALPSGSLATTGFNADYGLGVALLALMAGVGFMIVAARRRGGARH